MCVALCVFFCVFLNDNHYHHHPQQISLYNIDRLFFCRRPTLWLRLGCLCLPKELKARLSGRLGPINKVFQELPSSLQTRTPSTTVSLMVSKDTVGISYHTQCTQTLGGQDTEKGVGGSLDPAGIGVIGKKKKKKKLFG